MEDSEENIKVDIGAERVKDNLSTDGKSSQLYSFIFTFQQGLDLKSIRLQLPSVPFLYFL